MVDSILVLANNEDLLGSTGGIVNYKTYPMIRYRRRIMFSVEDLLGKCNLLNMSKDLKVTRIRVLLNSVGWRYGWASDWFLRSWRCRNCIFRHTSVVLAQQRTTSLLN